MKSFFVVIFLGVFLFFWLQSKDLLDPDFGWHLRMGQIILASGVPKTDQFSYTMPSYRYIDHSWLSEVIIARLYPRLDLSGLAVLAGIVGIGSLGLAILAAKKADRARFFLAPFILGAASLVGFIAVRPLIFTWLFFSFLIWLLFDPRRWARGKFFLPLIFLLWANLHGGFAGGLVALTVFLGVRLLFNRRRDQVFDLGVLILCFLATLVNPFGLSLWKEVFATVSTLSGKFLISEWTPGIFSFSPAWLFLVVLVLTLLWRYRQGIRIEKTVLFLTLLAQAVLVVRNVPLLVLVSLPLLIEGLTLFSEEAARVKAAGRFQVAYKGLVIISLLPLIFDLALSVWQYGRISETSFYPQKAVNYLSAHPTGGRLFSTYNWGGYLIWKLPEKKTFVDGRMPDWKWSNPPPGESSNAFADFAAITSGKKDYRYFFARYGIDTVLWPVPEKKTATRIWLEKNTNWVLKLFGVSSKEFDLTTKLKADGWREIYKDDVAVVFRRDRINL